jgi:ABC-type hemin transport system substrate-binding protein
MHPPQRIVCLTEETTETLYLLGEAHRIVGISGYTVRPPQARKEKPRVSAFISADIPKILALEPNLVLTFSDLHAEIAAALSRAADAAAADLKEARDVAEKLADQLRAANEQLQAAHEQLRAAHNQINDLKADVRHYQDRTNRAEKWLQQISSEIEQKFFGADNSRAVRRRAPSQNENNNPARLAFLRRQQDH